MRRFEVRELRPRKLAQLALVGSCAFVENNKGVRRHAPAFMRESDDRHLLHGRVWQLVRRLAQAPLQHCARFRSGRRREKIHLACRLRPVIANDPFAGDMRESRLPGNAIIIGANSLSAQRRT